MAFGGEGIKIWWGSLLGEIFPGRGNEWIFGWWKGENPASWTFLFWMSFGHLFIGVKKKNCKELGLGLRSGIFFRVFFIEPFSPCWTWFWRSDMLTSKKFLYVTYALTQFVKLWLFVEMFLKYFLISHPFYLMNFKVRYRSLIENPLHQQ